MPRPAPPAVGQHGERRAAQRPAPRPHRPEPEIHRLRQPALVGHARATGTPVPAGCRGADAGPRTTIRSADGSAKPAHRRAAEAPRPRGCDHDEHPVAARHHLVDERVAHPGEVEHDDVVTALRGRERLADGERLERSVRAGRPGQRARARPGAAAPRATPARSADRWSGRARPTGPPRRASRPEHPVDARAERVEVHHDGGPGPGGELAEGARERRRARAAGRRRPPRTSAPRTGLSSPASVSDSTTHGPNPAAPATFSAPIARAVRNISSGTSPQHDDVHAVASWRPDRRHLLGHVDTDQDERGARPAPQRGDAVVGDVGSDAGRGGQPQQLVEQHLVSGHEEWRGHAPMLPATPVGPTVVRHDLWRTATGSRTVDDRWAELPDR